MPTDEDVAAGATPAVLVAPDAAALAATTATRLVTALADAVAARGSAAVVLTGGGIGVATLRELARFADTKALDWRQVDVWYGDERFVGRDDADRNSRQAREAGLAALPLDPARVHEIASADEVATPEEAAQRYAAELLAGGGLPSFDVHLLGVGPEGHVNSLFPHSAALLSDEPVVAVHGCPKPPPVRVTLTLPVVLASRAVWVVASGPDKAEPLGKAAQGASWRDVPVAGARGREQTLWLLDRQAAAAL